MIGKNKLRNKVLSFMIAFIMTIGFATITPTAVHASSTSYVTVTKNKSFNENGKFYMKFTIKNLSDSVPLVVWAQLINSAGKEVVGWGSKQYAASTVTTRSYGADYNALPSGKYTFKLFCSMGYGGVGWQWSYTINHTRNESFNVTSFGKENVEGKLRYRWNLQCINLKGQKVTIKIFDSADNLVYQATGPARSTHNETGWFTWSGTRNVGSSNKKCTSGTYLVQFTATSSNKVVEKEYKLNLN
jgi:hypothetical protein